MLGATGEPTLGGVVASHLSGPRRIAWGATRDQVIGVRAVNGTGEVIRSGGRVLKNVTGLDLCKMLTGSHGTLAALTEITLKLLPAPAAGGTLVLPGLDAAGGVARLAAALGAPYGVSGAAWLPREAAALVPALAPLGSAVALVRIEDFATSVSYRLGRLREELGGGETLDDAASRAVWSAVREAVPLGVLPDEAVWRVSVRPSAGPAVLAALSQHAGRGFLDWGGGLVWIAGPGTAALHDAVCAAVRAGRGTWTLLRGPEPLRAAVDVIPPEAPALAAITRRSRRRLIPPASSIRGGSYSGL